MIPPSQLIDKMRPSFKVTLFPIESRYFFRNNSNTFSRYNSCTNIAFSRNSSINIRGINGTHRRRKTSITNEVIYEKLSQLKLKHVSPAYWKSSMDNKEYLITSTQTFSRSDDETGIYLYDIIANKWIFYCGYPEYFAFTNHGQFAADFAFICFCGKAYLVSKSFE